MFKNTRCGNNQKTNKTKWWLIALAMVVPSVGLVLPQSNQVRAESCPDLKVIFARGSGGERYTSGHYLAFKSALETKLATSDLTYEFEDLDYPAVSIDINDGHLGTLIGAYVGSGDAYDFGDSVHKGTAELLRLINGDSCKNTKYVLGGYSQGAVVLLNGLGQIDPSKIIYVATFGDPKIYLPEGAGLVPQACSGRNLSDYRIYVPDCRAYKGILGAREPYVIEQYVGKVGTWCNKYDILCSSHFSITSHTHYAEDGLYEDASKYIFSKIGAEFNFKNQYTSPHDTAILIDSTWSMDELIEQYKTEALRLAEKSLASGGRVALYDYRDVGDEYEPVEHCYFETCDLKSFKAGLDAISTGGGGDTPESLLSASLYVMKQLEWELGSTKSLVILTDAGYHSPDLDGTTFYDVKKMSKQIDPVNFYIITTETEVYQSLAEATGGKVVSTVDDLSILTDEIMENFESLPRVEEEFIDENYENTLPELQMTRVVEISETEVRVEFETDGVMTMVFLNDGMLGITEGDALTITDLKRDIENKITLVPLSETRRGESVSVTLPILEGYGGFLNDDVIVPKTPNTGMLTVLVW